MKKEQVKSGRPLIKQTKEASELESSLKKKYGEITKIEFLIKEKPMVAYLRQPSLAELDGTLTSLQTAPISTAVGLFRTLFVEGDKELIDLAEDTGIAIAISNQVQKTIPNVFSQSTVL